MAQPPTPSQAQACAPHPLFIPRQVNQAYSSQGLKIGRILNGGVVCYSDHLTQFSVVSTTTSSTSSNKGEDGGAGEFQFDTQCLQGPWTVSVAHHHGALVEDCADYLAWTYDPQAKSVSVSKNKGNCQAAVPIFAMDSVQSVAGDPAEVLRRARLWGSPPAAEGFKLVERLEHGGAPTCEA